MADAKKEKCVGDLFWADQVAAQVISERGNKELYVCASGISPSGVVHFGNLRETMTVDIVARALKNKGKKVRAIHSWDDFDRFRKVPAGIPADYEKYVGVPYSKIPDPCLCHNSYAEHFESLFEAELKKIGIFPEFIRQHEQYEKCVYAEEIKLAINERQKIREILNKYRENTLPESWYPIEIFCEKCSKDLGKVVEYDGSYRIKYCCECGFNGEADFRKNGIVKLLWRVDWPMRWAYEGVDFEPGGKEHSTPGGSRTTAKEIVEAVWKKKAPVYKKYEYIILKGAGGKMSGSKGNVITLSEVLKVYEPEIVRFMFAGIRPDAEFSVSFDLDVLKVYEDFDSCERIYYGKEEAKDEKELTNNKRIYEMSCVNLKTQMPFQPSFRHLTTILQVYENDFEQVKGYYKKELKTQEDLDKLKARAGCAWNWLQKYAPDDMKFEVQEKVMAKLTEQEKKSVKALAQLMKQGILDEEELGKRIYSLAQDLGVKPQDFFRAAYKALLNKEKGPRLAPFLLMLGDRATQLLEHVK